ncbi:hypothetical protein EVAR_30503_1 [Eumeta japonica]|uniref:Uncharacterized protein n=1 Tax=Eumeta variegata TaxID=151549 RepID=A0A4C1VZJ0_EUMVA|nr:hypothetical protein EVAR_30503_1 [Eumeta japonica]
MTKKRNGSAVDTSKKWFAYESLLFLMDVIHLELDFPVFRKCHEIVFKFFPNIQGSVIRCHCSPGKVNHSHFIRCHCSPSALGNDSSREIININTSKAQ